MVDSTAVVAILVAGHGLQSGNGRRKPGAGRPSFDSDNPTGISWYLLWSREAFVFMFKLGSIRVMSSQAIMFGSVLTVSLPSFPLRGPNIFTRCAPFPKKTPLYSLSLFFPLHSVRWCVRFVCVLEPRFEKRHKNMTVHCAPCWQNVKEGDIVTIGQCRPLSKTVRFNVLEHEACINTVRDN